MNATSKHPSIVPTLHPSTLDGQVKALKSKLDRFEARNLRGVARDELRTVRDGWPVVSQELAGCLRRLAIVDRTIKGDADGRYNEIWLHLQGRVTSAFSQTIDALPTTVTCPEHATTWTDGFSTLLHERYDETLAAMARYIGTESAWSPWLLLFEDGPGPYQAGRQQPYPSASTKRKLGETLIDHTVDGHEESDLAALRYLVDRYERDKADKILSTILDSWTLDAEQANAESSKRQKTTGAEQESSDQGHGGGIDAGDDTAPLAYSYEGTIPPWCHYRPPIRVELLRRSL